MVEVEVASISVDHSVGTPVVFLREKEGSPKQILLIWIRDAEALAIQCELKGEQLPRPMTHDLMKTIVEELGGKITSVCISDMKESTYYAQITLEVNGQTVEIDSRPSDAIALGLRFGASVYVAEEVIQEHGFSEVDLKEAQKQQTKSVLENLDEDTLGQYTV